MKGCKQCAIQNNNKGSINLLYPIGNIKLKYSFSRNNSTKGK